MAFGDDEDISGLFDLKIQKAKMPEFFMQESMFYKYCRTNKKLKAKWDRNFLDMELLGGNVSQLNSMFQELFGPNFKVLLIGTGAVTDAGYPFWESHTQNPFQKNWDSLVLLEELKQISDKNEGQVNIKNRFLKGFGNG